MILSCSTILIVMWSKVKILFIIRIQCLKRRVCSALDSIVVVKQNSNKLGQSLARRVGFMLRKDPLNFSYFLSLAVRI